MIQALIIASLFWQQPKLVDLGIKIDPDSVRDGVLIKSDTCTKIYQYVDGVKKTLPVLPKDASSFKVKMEARMDRDGEVTFTICNFDYLDLTLNAFILDYELLIRGHLVKTTFPVNKYAARRRDP